jgi:hypothetical protein
MDNKHNHRQTGISLAGVGLLLYTQRLRSCGINVKPIDGSTQNTYANSDRQQLLKTLNHSLWLVQRNGGTNYTEVSAGKYSCMQHPLSIVPTVNSCKQCGNLY